MTEYKRSEEISYYCCGLPIVGGRISALFCGVTLMAFGAAWLLSNLHLIPDDWWEYLLSLLLISWGAAIIWTTRNPY